MILAINSGSTSVKYKLFDAAIKEIFASELAGRHPNAQVFKTLKQTLAKQGLADNHLKIVHRVVHGGPDFFGPIKLSTAVLEKIKRYSQLAPLHNPYNIKGIELAGRFFPESAQYAVFDTAFYSSLPERAKIYPLPMRFYEEYKIKKYGFHGLSHQYALEVAKKTLGKSRPNLISLHLGSGCSITAIKQGVVVDTSMGYTPLEGLMMWSRGGDIDLGVILQNPKSLRTNDGAESKNWKKILNFESGLMGIAGPAYHNYLEIIHGYEAGERLAKLAIEMFVYCIQKYIGAYSAILNDPLDGLIFTGKIGAGLPLTRELICQPLKCVSQVPQLVIPPNEEKMMAQLICDLS